jgi:hypothetical protein
MNHAALAGLIGRRFRYRGRAWVVLEVMPDANRIVLSPEGGARRRSIQSDQYGQPLRRCPDCLSLPISTSDGDAYSEDMLELLGGSITGPVPNGKTG